MRRLILPATLALATTLSLSGCFSKGASSQVMGLVPEGAEMIGGINVQSFVKSPLYSENKDQMEKDAKDVVDAMKSCKIDPEKLEAVVFGADSKNHGVVIIVGEGVGVEDNIKCAIEKVKEKDSSAKVELTDKDGKRVVDVDGGKAYGYMVDARTLAFAEKDWAPKLLERMEGKGTAAIDGGLKPVMSLTDTSKSLWFAGNVPSGMGAGLGPAGSAKSAGGWMDVSSGLALNVSATFGSADDAKSVSDEMTKQFNDVKGLAGLVGIPSSVVDSVKIEAADVKVTVSASATKEDLEQINKTLKQFAGG